MVADLGCSWKEAREMIEEAQASLGIDASTSIDEAQEAANFEKVKEIWETTRKPTTEQVAAKQKAREAQADQERLDKLQEGQDRQKQKDEDFRSGLLCCITCGMSITCRKSRT